MITQDPTNVKNLNDRAIAGQLERLLGARSHCSRLYGCEPSTTSPATLSDHWRMIDALQATNAGGNLLEVAIWKRSIRYQHWMSTLRPSDQVKGSVELSGQSPG